MNLDLERKVTEKELRDKNLIRKLCYQLDIDFSNVIGFNPEFTFYGGLSRDKYLVYNDIQCINGGKYGLEFKFSIEYPRRYSVITKEELDSDIPDTELDMMAELRRNFKSIYIEYVSVYPQGQGTGTILTNLFIKRIKALDKFENIFLYAKNNRAENFWRKIGFRATNINDLDLNKYSRHSSADMVYDIKLH